MYIHMSSGLSILLQETMRDEFDSDDSEYGSEVEDNGSFHHAGLNFFETWTFETANLDPPRVFLLAHPSSYKLIFAL